MDLEAIKAFVDNVFQDYESMKINKNGVICWIESALAQAREGGKEGSHEWAKKYYPENDEESSDPLAANLEKLAEGILPEHQHWIWDKEKYHLKVVSVFQAANAKYRKNRKLPLAAVDAALEEAEE
jgi:hypothetical protein